LRRRRNASLAFRYLKWSLLSQFIQLEYAAGDSPDGTYIGLIGVGGTVCIIAIPFKDRGIGSGLPNKQSIGAFRVICSVQVYEVEEVILLCHSGPIGVMHAPEIRNIPIILWINRVGLLLLLSRMVIFTRLIRHVELVIVLII